MALQNDTQTGKNYTEDSPDGFIVGQNATTSKVGFYGTTPIIQRTNAAQAAVVDTSGGTATALTGITTITGTYNSVILANAIATIAAQTNELRAALVAVGLIKGS